MEKGLVIFDMDGTLYQTHITSISATQRAMEEFGLRTPEPGEIMSLVGETMDVFCSKIAPKLDKDKQKELSDRITYYEKKAIAECGKVFDGVENMLSELRGLGYKLAVCSNGRMQYIDCILSSCNIKQYFDYVKGREAGKTKGDLVGELLKETGADSAVFVGDRFHDIDAAHENNIPCIGAEYGYGGDEMEKADFTVENPGQIVDYVVQCSLYSDIERSIETNKGKRTVIGVNGVDTSGKTQFSSKLKRFLQARRHKVCLIHMDDFHNPSSIRGQGDNPIESYINNAFNLELLDKEILLPLKNEGLMDKELTLLDLESDQYNSKKHFYIDEETIVIIEGVLLYREPIDKYFDLRIFLDISFDEVLRRAEIRDVPLYGEAFLKKYKDKYIPIQQKYKSECKPIEKSDFVIDNTNYNRPERIK